MELILGLNSLQPWFIDWNLIKVTLSIKDQGILYSIWKIWHLVLFINILYSLSLNNLLETLNLSFKFFNSWILIILYCSRILTLWVNLMRLKMALLEVLKFTKSLILNSKSYIKVTFCLFSPSRSLSLYEYSYN
jgi:hypothetical protein